LAATGLTARKRPAASPPQQGRRLPPWQVRPRAPPGARPPTPPRPARGHAINAPAGTTL
jgi:hypothetical protein